MMMTMTCRFVGWNDVVVAKTLQYKEIQQQERQEQETRSSNGSLRHNLFLDGTFVSFVSSSWVCVWSLFVVCCCLFVVGCGVVVAVDCS